MTIPPLPQPVTLPVAEVFGPVYQGEGPHTGRRCSFVRLGLCNLRCTWCDTPFTWDSSRYDVNAECPPTTPAEIIHALNGHDTDLMILSGGEPLIHQGTQGMEQLLDGWDGDVHVETNGTLVPLTSMVERVSHFSVSPKLRNQGDPFTRRVKPKALHTFAALAQQQQAIFKFVVCDPPDLDEVNELVGVFNIPVESVWVMPEGTDAATIIDRARQLEPLAHNRHFNLTLRQHVLIHGNERGW